MCRLSVPLADPVDWANKDDRKETAMTGRKENHGSRNIDDEKKRQEGRRREGGEEEEGKYTFENEKEEGRQKKEENGMAGSWQK